VSRLCYDLQIPTSVLSTRVQMEHRVKTTSMAIAVFVWQDTRALCVKQVIHETNFRRSLLYWYILYVSN